MSWKSFITAGLLCVLASPAFAAPAVTISNAGLNATGQWVWNVRIANTGPGPAPPTGDSPLAAELGFRVTASTLVSAATLNPSTNFDTANPGNKIFTWETLTNLGGTGSCNSGNPGNCPVGLQTNVGTNEIFSALGSIDFTTIGPHDYITIVTSGPTASNANAPAASHKSAVQMLGAYSGNGRIAEATVAAPGSANYDTYADQQFIVATPGDTNLVGGVDLTDFNTVLDNFGKNGYWQIGNFHANDGTAVNLSDFNTVLDAFGRASGVQGSGAGPGAGASIAGSTVPEPSSIFLLGFGIFTLLSGRRRK